MNKTKDFWRNYKLNYQKIKASLKGLNEDYRVSYGDIIDYINKNCPQTPLYKKTRAYCYQKLRNAMMIISYNLNYKI